MFYYIYFNAFTNTRFIVNNESLNYKQFYLFHAVQILSDLKLGQFATLIYLILTKLQVFLMLNRRYNNDL